MKGQTVSFDIVDNEGKIIVPRDKRITAKHVRDLAKAGISEIPVPDDYILGRTLAKTIVDESTGEIIANANAEITDAVLAALRGAGVAEIETLFTNEARPRRLHLADAPSDDTPDQFAARVSIYRMMRRANPHGRSRGGALRPSLLRRRRVRSVARGPHEGQRALPAAPSPRAR